MVYYDTVVQYVSHYTTGDSPRPHRDLMGIIIENGLSKSNSNPRGVLLMFHFALVSLLKV